MPSYVEMNLEQQHKMNHPAGNWSQIANGGDKKPPIDNPKHYINEEVAKTFTKDWIHFNELFDQLCKAVSNVSDPNLCKELVGVANELKQYFLIHFELFDLTDNDFRNRLQFMLNHATTLQIAFGMKEVPNNYKEKYKEAFAKKDKMACVVLFGRDKNGDLIPGL